MLVNLIIDGNFLLSKLVFTLHKHNLLYGGLHKALESTLSNYRKLFPFSNVYLISDSREKSWRKDLIDDYKTNRKKDSNIDWSFVYQAYEEFKTSIKSKLIVLESSRIEGDDWISFIVEKSNFNAESCFIISNDYDIKQLVKYSIDPLYINIMSNEMYNKEKLFLPINYQVFINSLSKISNDNIFILNDNSEFIDLLKRLINKYELNEINNVESLFIKIISGDSSDNISSVWKQTKNGKTRGIGAKGAKDIYDQYILEFGDIKMNDLDLYENIADLICEKKKLSKNEIPDIISNIKRNIKLIDLSINNIPKSIVNKMNEVYDSRG